MHKSWKLRLLPFVALFLGGFASLPANEHRLVSTRLRNTADTLLGRAFLEEVNANPGKTGVMTIARCSILYLAQRRLRHSLAERVVASRRAWRTHPLAPR